MNVDVSELFRVIGELTIENRLLKTQVEELKPPVSPLRPVSEYEQERLRELVDA